MLNVSVNIYERHTSVSRGDFVVVGNRGSLPISLGLRYIYIYI